MMAGAGAMLALSAGCAWAQAGAPATPGELEARYQQMCGPGTALSAATCQALAKDVARAKAAGPAAGAAPAGGTAAAGGAAAAVADPAKLRAAYDRLCVGGGSRSSSVCAALEQDVAALGASDDADAVARRQAAAETFIRGFAGGQISDAQLWGGQRAELRKAINAYQNHVSALGALKSLRWLRLENGEDVYEGRHEQASVEWRFVMRPDGSVVGVHFKDSVRLNANREGRQGKSITVDPIVPGQKIFAMFENTDGSLRGWPWREDCYRIVAPPGTTVKISLYTDGLAVGSYVGANCGYNGEVHLGDGASAFAFYAQQGAQPLYLFVSGRAMTNQPYQVYLETVTAQQYAEFQERQRQQQIADARQRQIDSENRSAMFGAIVTGLAAGFTNTSPPLMNSDGSAPNPLETLNAINGQLAQRNAEGQARLDATIAAARAQGEQQARARAEAEQQQRVQAQAQRAAQDRNAATIAFGNARSGIEQKLREAQAGGDAQQQAFWQGKLKENEALATQYGVSNEVRQYAQTNVRTPGQGKLGQTPLGGFPDPVKAPNTQRPTQLAQAGGTPAGAARIPSCISRNPDECLVQPKDRGTTGGQGGAGAGTGGQTRGAGVGSGAGSGVGSGSPGTPPGGRPPGGGTSPGQPRPPGGGQVDTRTWFEGVVLCEKIGPQAQFNNWTCHGPLQMNYVNFEKANWGPQLALTCGGNDTPRDLGVVATFRVFGCGYPVDPSNNDAWIDVTKRFGVSYVPGRTSYRCPTGRRSCQPS